MTNDMESRLAVIEARNRRVDMDKKWETSWTRRIVIALLTYAVVCIYLVIIGNNNPFVNAFVPPTGFILSTMVAKSIRNIWLQKQK